MTRGLVVAAPASGSGKTVVTLALLRAFRRRGLSVASLKIGPDYIDPALHARATGRRSGNFDGWGMRPATLDAQRVRACDGSDLVIAEGVMGLFDGAAGDGGGSTADAATRLGWPVVLVVDVRGQGASAAALVEGFARHRADTRIAGIIFNRVGSARHADLLRQAMAETRIPIIGMVPRTAALDLPERHLGLVQAAEQTGLESWLEAAATVAAESIDLDALEALAAPPPTSPARRATAPLPPPGRRIAVAADAAFSFRYAHVLDGWAAEGATVRCFSPLADEPPQADADAVYLPGGYPELHAARLTGNATFLAGVRRAAERGATVFGECGGFMVLGRALIDGEGRRHAMAGLLPVETSFAAPRLHLGYRTLRLREDGFLGPAGASYRGHEFHYSSLLRQDGGTALFEASDTSGMDAVPAGCRVGNVMGAYVHLIDRAG